ncbi:MAG: hydrolase 76 protein [Stictis urceolatum]|nr:hydrolase 76 protein [Stictis urceolata]
MVPSKGLSIGGAILKVLALATGVTAIDLDVTNPNSIKTAASIASDNAWTFYPGDKPGQIPGLLVQPYYWWECGAMFGLLIQRWSITGNDTYNDAIKEGTLFQVGEDEDFKPKNQTADLGNDDQLYWALTAMDMAEQGFDNPAAPNPSWLGLAQAVFNEQVAVWDPTTCDGGMRWQIYSFNPGWNYKNTMTNGGFFQLAARLARYTGNMTYAHYAERTWDWISQTPIFDNSTAGRIHIWDGIWTDRCTTPSKVDWSYNSATLIVGSAFLWSHYNLTGNTSQETLDTWDTRINLLMNSTSLFYKTSSNPALASLGSDILLESCELPNPQSCDQDQPIFKAFTTRWMALTALLAPWTNSTINPRLVASAKAAAQACVGSTSDAQQPGTVCGRRWWQTGFDGNYGVGEQLSAMSAFQSLLLGVPGQGGKGQGADGMPFTTEDGGSSTSDPGAGKPADQPGSSGEMPTDYGPITAGSKAGAAFLTILGVGGWLGMLGWATFV